MYHNELFGLRLRKLRNRDKETQKDLAEFLGESELCSRYENAALFSSVYNLTDPFDYEGMVSGHRQFKKNCDSLFEMLVGKSRNFLLLSNEGCNRCESCTYPENKCRMPEKLFPSVEGFGINVVALASKVGLKYNNGENTVTYFGMLMF